MNIWTDANGWPIPPIILLGCLLAEILYVRGWRVLVTKEQEQEAARGIPSPIVSHSPGTMFQRNIWFWRGILFLCSMLTFLLAACAPIDNLAGRLFWVHMVQHLLLLVVMAPLLVAGCATPPVVAGPTTVGQKIFTEMRDARGQERLHTRRALVTQPCYLMSIAHCWYMGMALASTL